MGMVSIPLLSRGIAAIGCSLAKRQESKRSCSERGNVVQLASGSGMLGRIPPQLRYNQTVCWLDATVPRLGMFCSLALRLSLICEPLSILNVVPSPQMSFP